MAILQCPECGAKVSDQAEVCKYCGYPIREKNIVSSYEGIVVDEDLALKEQKRIMKGKWKNLNAGKRTI